MCVTFARQRHVAAAGVLNELNLIYWANQIKLMLDTHESRGTLEPLGAVLTFLINWLNLVQFIG